MAHGVSSNADFFLLATPDKLYVWKDSDASPVSSQPLSEIDAQPIFAPYFERAGLDPGNVSGHAFELVVAAWLSDLARSDELSENSNGEKSLVESGFFEAVRKGRLEYQAGV